jgi:hypothetical protein
MVAEKEKFFIFPIFSRLRKNTFCMIYNERILCAMGKSAPKNSSLRRPKVTLRSAKRKIRSFSPLDICSMLRVIGWRLNVNKNSEPKVLASLPSTSASGG